MKRKLVSLMLVVSMTAAMVAGCGSDDKKMTAKKQQVVLFTT